MVSPQFESHIVWLSGWNTSPSQWPCTHSLPDILLSINWAKMCSFGRRKELNMHSVAKSICTASRILKSNVKTSKIVAPSANTHQPFRWWLRLLNDRDAMQLFATPRSYTNDAVPFVEFWGDNYTFQLSSLWHTLLCSRIVLSSYHFWAKSDIWTFLNFFFHYRSVGPVCAKNVVAIQYAICELVHV